MVSMSGPARGLQNWAREHFAEGHPSARRPTSSATSTSSLIKTVQGRTITVVHDTNLPRPYSRVNIVQGTRGIVKGYPDRVYIDGRSAALHRWDAAEKWRAEFDHPLWRSEAIQKMDVAMAAWDFLEDYRLIACLRAGTSTDINV